MNNLMTTPPCWDVSVVSLNPNSDASSHEHAYPDLLSIRVSHNGYITSV